MKQSSVDPHQRAFGFVILMLFALSSRIVTAQSDATAVQPLALSAFALGTGTYTDVLGGRNLGFTGGADLSFLSYRKLRPVAEFRGNYPVYNGRVDNQRSLLGGLRIERQIGQLHPYVDFLIGRGAIEYPNGLQNGNLVFLRTVSTVYSPGLGVDFDVSRSWAGRLDFQYQHWDTPAVTSGVVNPKVLSAGVVYRFDFNHHYRR